MRAFQSVELNLLTSEVWWLTFCRLSTWKENKEKDNSSVYFFTAAACLFIQWKPYVCTTDKRKTLFIQKYTRSITLVIFKSCLSNLHESNTIHTLKLTVTLTQAATPNTYHTCNYTWCKIKSNIYCFDTARPKKSIPQKDVFYKKKNQTQPLQFCPIYEWSEMV